VDVAISCGLAGGLRDDVPSGAVLIPAEVCSVDGERRACDPEFVQALSEAARSLGFEPMSQPLLTATSIVRGGERARWARRGFIGVDMESASLRSNAVAAVRIVLDTPKQEISADWERPLMAVLRPWNWPQAIWLARFAPGYARRAALIVHKALAGR
jgi:nucleoside phosphorylase